MTIFISIIVFIIVLGLLVLFHEFGHFIMAKRSGMKVEEFGIGFPPRLFGFQRGETLYSINAVPLGGFVRIMGENNEHAEDPRSFINKPFWPRFFTLIAGVLMNFIFAWVLISVGYVIGLPTAVEPGQTVPAHARLTAPSLAILLVAPDSPAAKAGLQEGDQITALNNQPISDVNALVGYVNSHKGQNINFDIKRGSESLHISAMARANPPAGEGPIGIEPGELGMISYAWYYAPIVGAQTTWAIAKSTFVAFYQLIRQGQGLSQLGGPIRIAALTNQVTQLGFVYVLQFAALLSINLGIINSIPFPALDGGRVLFLIIEKIRGRRNNQRVENLANTIGFALLIILVLLISFRDVRVLIHK